MALVSFPPSGGMDGKLAAASNPTSGANGSGQFPPSGGMDGKLAAASNPTSGANGSGQCPPSGGMDGKLAAASNPTSGANGFFKISAVKRDEWKARRGERRCGFNEGGSIDLLA
jgi:hypothetical protein